VAVGEGRVQALVPAVAALAVCPEEAAQARAALARAAGEDRERPARLAVFGRAAAVVQEALEAV
jgi:hypothetical protein